MSETSTDSKGQASIPPLQKPDHEECLRILNLVLDGEASELEHRIFSEHLENCMPYFEIYNIDRKIRELIKTKCSDKKLSEDVKQQIRERVFNLID
jgi:anti-sigma factor (TIGR02949 family)